MLPIFIYHILIRNSPFGGGSEPPPKFFCYTYILRYTLTFYFRLSLLLNFFLYWVFSATLTRN